MNKHIPHIRFSLLPSTMGEGPVTKSYNPFRILQPDYLNQLANHWMDIADDEAWHRAPHPGLPVLFCWASKSRWRCIRMYLWMSLTKEIEMQNFNDPRVGTKVIKTQADLEAQITKLRRDLAYMKDAIYFGVPVDELKAHIARSLRVITWPKKNKKTHGYYWVLWCMWRKA